MENRVIIKHKRHIDYIIFWFIMLSASAFFLIWGLYNLDFIMILIGFIWGCAVCYIYGSWKDSGYISMNKESIEIGLNEETDVFRWEQIGNMRFEYKYNLKGCIGSTLHIKINNLDYPFFFDYDIKEEKFKEYAIFFAKKEVFKDDYSVYSKLYSKIRKALSCK